MTMNSNFYNEWPLARWRGAGVPEADLLAPPPACTCPYVKVQCAETHTSSSCAGPNGRVPCQNKTQRAPPQSTEAGVKCQTCWGMAQVAPPPERPEFCRTLNETELVPPSHQNTARGRVHGTAIQWRANDSRSPETFLQHNGRLSWRCCHRVGRTSGGTAATIEL